MAIITTAQALRLIANGDAAITGTTAHPSIEGARMHIVTRYDTQSTDHCDALDEKERMAFYWAKNEQGYAGTFTDWLALSASEREEYEDGARGISA